jgi:ATP-dependent Clp protease ATP-binding subunit ClpA
MAGNIGSTDNKRSMGFHNNKTNDEVYNSAVKKNFRPEIIARIDEMIVFNEIDEKTAKMIVWDSVYRVVANLKEQQITLTVDNSVVDFIHELAKTQEAHARNVHALVRKNLETPLSKILLKSKPKKLTAKMIENKLEISLND